MGEHAPRWIRWWFRGAALWGVVALVPTYFTAPPGPAALTHYAFTGTALAFQIVFWIIAGAPLRHRPLMLAGVAEKLGFGLPALALAAAGQVPGIVLVPAAIDLLLGAGFFLAWRATASLARQRRA